jgi:hypothetical protein
MLEFATLAISFARPTSSERGSSYENQVNINAKEIEQMLYSQ